MCLDGGLYNISHRVPEREVHRKLFKNLILGEK
jgi:hypothetical protein